MATSSNRAMRRTGRLAGIGFAALFAGPLLLLGSPASAATQVEGGSVPLSSLPTTQSIVLDQFDDTSGSLDQVTVTVAVDATTDVEVTNLTAAAKATTVALEATASATGPGVTALTASVAESQSPTLDPDETLGFAIDGSAAEPLVITDLAVLTQFAGTGTVTFDVTGAWNVDVQGPAVWRSQGSAGATATVTVEYEFSLPPVAVDDAANVVEDDPAAPIDVLANDTDPDGGLLAIDSVTQPANGTVAITNAGADLTYAPDLDYCNDPPGTTPDTFSYTLNGGSAATVSVTVTCVDDAPVAFGDSATVAEDAAATTVDVLANDTDVDGGPIAIDSITQPTNGTVVITNAGADLTYTPDPDYCNDPPGTTPETFTYSLTPGGSTATVSVTVTCADDPPTAVDDTATVAEDSAATPIAVLANDADVDGGPIAIDTVTQPANGTVAITNAGADLTYTPDPDYCNDPPGTTPDTFDYTLVPGGSTATVSVTVTCVDDSPLAVDDTTTVVEDDPATTVDVLANDTDVDGGPIAIDSVTQPANGTVVITNAGADLTYTPDPDYCNDPPGTTLDMFTYGLAPGGSIATVSVTVSCVDDPPTAVADSASVAEDSAATTVDVLANDTDPDGGSIAIDTVTQPANGTVVITNAGADLTYAPDPDYCNDPPGTTPDTFDYTLTPGGSTTIVSVTVTCVDDPPTAVDDAATVAEDAAASTVDVFANDTDLDGGPISVDSVTQPTNGTVAITNGGADLTYTPNPDYCNDPPGTTPDTFTYTLTPGGSTATVSVTVTCVDDSPVAFGDSATVAEDATATTVDVLANDTDVDGGPISIDSVTQPGNGTVVITNAGADLTYVPDPDYCNDPPGTTPDTFTYTLAPGGSIATVDVTVTCVGDDPTAVADGATVAEDSSATTIDVLANDTDPDGGPIAIDSVTQPANGAVVITNAGADLTYTPDPDYCNDPPGTTPDTFDYTLAPGGSTATVSVDVACVDDPPTAVDDAATVVEDAAATTIAVLANDTDIDGGPISIDTATQPANGTVVINGAGADYTPDPDYCNDPPGTTPDTFDYTLAPGGSTATVSVTVTCVDDPPVAVDDATMIVEDDPATTIDVLANDTDSDGGPISIDTVTQPANGTVVITNAGADLTFLPDPNYCNDPPGTTPDTFDYTLAPGGSSATVSVTVTCVLEDPVAVADSATVAEDASATTIDVLANDLDPDSLGPTISTVTQPTNGTVVITNAGADLTYAPDLDYCNAPPGTTPDTFTYSLAPGGSTAIVSVTVTCVDDSPVAFADSATVAEDAPATTINALANDTDVDGGPFAIDSVTQPANGTVVVTNAGADLTYLPDPNYCNDPPGTTPDTFTYTLAPGGSSATVSVTVTCQNDAPTITPSGATPTFTEDGAPVTVDGGLTVTDPDDTDLESGTVTITAGGQTGDALTFTPGTTGITDTNLAVDILALTGTATVGDWQTVLRSVQFSTTDQNPTTARTVRFVVSDGTATSNNADKAVTVVPVNDAPVLTQPDAATLTFNENTAPIVMVPGITATDVDSANLASAVIDIGTGYVNGQDVLSLGTNPQNGITAGAFDAANGTLTLTGSSLVANYQTALRDVRFVNTSDNPTGGVRNITFQVNDGAAANNLSNTVSRNVNVVPVNDPPVAGDDAFIDANGALANTRLVVGTTTTGPHLAVAGTVLSNDSDPDTASGLTAGPATISSASCAGCNNVALNANGSFTYDPPAGFTGTDTFTYTVNDNDPETPANQTDTATVSIEVFGPLVWYVDVDAAAPPAGQGGRSHSPFQSLAPLTTGGTADGLDGNGDVIFLGVDSAAPIAAYDGGIVLETNQRLLGEPFGLTIDPGGAAAGTPPSTVLVAAGAAGAALNPTVRNSAAGGVAITLANGVEVQRVNAGITGSGSATGISGTAITTATIGTDTLIQGNTVGISLTGAAGGNISIAAAINGNSGTTVNVANRSGGTVAFSGNITGSSTNSAITLGSNSGATIDFSGALNINSTGAGVTAFSASGGGTVIADNAANQVATFAGTGVNLNGIAIGADGVTFATVSSAAGGATNGILLTNVSGPGAFTVNGGSITATTRGLDVDGGSGAVTINATLTTSGAAARSVEVTNRTGGTVDINGLVTDTSQGINLSTNGAGLVRFDGGVVVSTTGANVAFNASVSGNVAVTDTNGSTLPNNTLTSTGATALSIQNTTIHTDSLTFLSISSGNNTGAADPANGIVLNTTGSSGSLTVTGNAGTCTSVASCTGGAIRNTTSHGILLTSTQSPSFTRIAVQDTAGSGIEGTSVTNFTLQNSFIDTSGTGGGADDSNVAFNNQAAGTERNVSGTLTVTNNILTNGRWHGLMVQNFNGTLDNAIVTGNTITSSTNLANSLGYGINFQILGSATTVSNLTKATISGNTVTNFPSAGGIQVQGGNSNAAGAAGIFGTSGAGNSISITSNLVRGQNAANRMATSAILVTLSGKGTGFVNVDNNGTAAVPLGNNTGTTIGVGANGNTTLTATTNGNFVESNHPGTTGDSGISGGVGVTFGVTDVANMTWTINNNTIRNVDGNGILAVARGTNGALRVKIQNNDVEMPQAGVRPGIRVDAGNTTAGSDNDVCLNISGNTSAGSGGTQGIGLRKQGTSTTVHAFGVNGMAATSSPGVETYVNGLNPAGNGTLLISAASGFSNCSFP